MSAVGDVTEVEAFLVEDDGSEEAVLVAAEKVKRPYKRRRPSAQSMTAAEAKAQASREGLAFITSASSATGFYGVAYDARGSAFPYKLYNGHKAKGTYIGSYATAEEAALVLARRVGNTAERCVSLGQHAKSRDAIVSAQGFTLVCQNAGCCTLVDLWVAKREACERQQANYALGDGCGACARRKPGCTKWFKPDRWRNFQIKMATCLLEGKRRLIAWPSGPATSRVEDVVALVKSDDEAQAAAQAAIAELT